MRRTCPRSHGWKRWVSNPPLCRALLGAIAICSKISRGYSSTHQLNINLSQALEQRLAEIVRQEKRSQWLAENQDALEEYNQRIEKRGTFSDGLRRF